MTIFTTTKAYNLGVLACGLLLLVGYRSPAHATALTAAERQALAVPERDKLHKIKGPSYVRSNENELQLWFPHVQGLGGGYVGVGADQNYTLSAKARSSHVWLMDYDPSVVRLHWIYRALILESPTRDDFIALWRNRRQVPVLLAKHYAGSGRLAKLLWIYKRYRLFLQPYHRWSKNRRRKGTLTTWLSDPELYKRVRKMYQEGRITAVPGDLHGPNVLKGICASARRLGVKIRVVYLSNAESYLKLSKPFISNMNAVPWDEKTLMVRTVRGPKYRMKSDRWHYNIQPFGADYLRRLNSGRYRHINEMMHDFELTPSRVRRALQRPRGFSRFTADVLDMNQYRSKARARRSRRRKNRLGARREQTRRKRGRNRAALRVHSGLNN